MSASDLLQAYALRIRELRRANAEVPETALAPAFQQLLVGLFELLPFGRGLIVMRSIGTLASDDLTLR